MKILRIDAVITMTGLPRSTIYLYMKQDDFPKSIKLGARSVGWIEEELQMWIEKKQNKRG